MEDLEGQDQNWFSKDAEGGHKFNGKIINQNVPPFTEALRRYQKSALFKEESKCREKMHMKRFYPHTYETLIKFGFAIRL